MNDTHNTLNIDSGDYVLVPKSDFEALQERLEIAEAAHVSNAIKSGADEAWPFSLVEALLDGQNPIRVFRKHRGMTASQLAKKIGISPPYFSKLETGKKDGPLEVIKAISSALGVSIDDLV